MAIDNDVLLSELDSNNNSWILDSGATAHMCNNKSYMYDIEPSYSKVSFGIKDSVSNGEFTGKIDFEITNFNVKKISVAINNVVYFRDLRRNLISVPVLKLGGFTLVDKGDFISAKKGTIELDFHVKYPSGYSYLMGPNISVIRHDYGMISRVELHEKLGHPGYNRVVNTSKYLGLNLQNDEKEVCESCSITKSRR